jgi:hypothetical protein
MFNVTRFAAATFMAMISATALAQTATNPLRPANTRNAAPAATTAPAPTSAKADDEKPKRQRSEAQLANDNRMRACGKEWRENKQKLTAQSKTWRVFNVECRARLKAAGQ